MFLSQNSREDGGIDTASSLSSDDSEVTVLSPGSAPRVLDNPEGNVVFSSVSDDEDSVVQTGSITVSWGWWVDDSTAVSLNVVGIQSNRNGSIGIQKGGHLGLISSAGLVVGEASVVLDWDDEICLVDFWQVPSSAV